MANIYVTKAATPKQKDNVALIHTQEDVPAFLAKVVIVSECKIYIGTCIEGAELVPVNNFIAWEPDESCEGGYNVWCKSNGHDTLFMHKDVWYERPTVVKYSEIDWSNPEIPAFAANAPIEVRMARLFCTQTGVTRRRVHLNPMWCWDTLTEVSRF